MYTNINILFAETLIMGHVPSAIERHIIKALNLVANDRLSAAISAFSQKMLAQQQVEGKKILSLPFMALRKLGVSDPEVRLDDFLRVTRDNKRIARMIEIAAVKQPGFKIELGLCTVTLNMEHTMKPLSEIEAILCDGKQPFMTGRPLYMGIIMEYIGTGPTIH